MRKCGGRVLLNVKRFAQKPSECAIAVSSSLANFYEPDVDYKDVRELVPPSQRSAGLYSSQQGRLLNKLGFERVTIVTADLGLVDFSWQKFSKKRLISRLKRLRAYYGRARDKGTKGYVHDMIRWLEDDCYDNRLVISDDFSRLIRKELNKGRPLGASIDWTSTFKRRKATVSTDREADIHGWQENHAIIIRGYDDQGVFVVDSHSKYYNGPLKKYRCGYYKLPWDRFLVHIPAGDLLLV